MTVPMQLIQNLDDEEKGTLAHQLLAAMDQGGIERRQMWPVFDEGDYVAGALTVMNALGLWDYVGGRAMKILSGTALPLGDHQKRPTDQDKLKYLLAEVERIREANDWEPAGTVVRSRVLDGSRTSLVAWHDGSGGFIVGKTKRGYEKNLDDAHEVSYFRNAETAEALVDNLFAELDA